MKTPKQRLLHLGPDATRPALPKANPGPTRERAPDGSGPRRSATREGWIS